MKVSDSTSYTYRDKAKDPIVCCTKFFTFGSAFEIHVRTQPSNHSKQPIDPKDL